MYSGQVVGEPVTEIEAADVTAVCVAGLGGALVRGR